MSPRFQNQRLVPEGTRFVPPRQAEPHGAATSREIFPEELVFDKADRAESLTKLRAAHRSLEAKVTELEAELKNHAEGPERDALQRRLDRARELCERLSRRIDEADDR